MNLIRSIWYQNSDRRTEKNRPFLNTNIKIKNGEWQGGACPIIEKNTIVNNKL